jgi:RNA polymerase sigma-70 factor (ECF subfamily)
MSDPYGTTWVGGCLDRLRSGDPAARDDLLRFAVARLDRLARAMLRSQFERVGRWADPDDVVQSASLRLWRALAAVTPESPLHFHRLAARLVRRELIDLARHLYGPEGLGANYESHMMAGPEEGSSVALPGAADPAAPDPARVAEWADLHTLVQTLPDEEAAVTDLVFYQGLTQEEAAELLGVDVRTVQRRWQRARRTLGELLAGPPG